jgi:hypothetical protein
MKNHRLNHRHDPLPTNGSGSVPLLVEEAPLKENLVPLEDIRALGDSWSKDTRWKGVTRTYTAEKVLRLRGTIKIEHTVADQMSRKLWRLLRSQSYVHA